ncbi:MAG: SRPBCC family protein [Sulfuricaulis sp.]
MPDILHRVGINAKPERVFKALTTIDGLRGWWVAETAGDAGIDGTINFGFCQMQVIEAVPAQLVRWRCVQGPEEWLGTEVTFALVWKDEQTFILFKHADWKKPVEFMHHCSTKWATFLLSLRDLLEMMDGHPAPRDIKIHVGD